MAVLTRSDLKLLSQELSTITEERAALSRTAITLSPVKIAEKVFAQLFP